MASPKVIIVTGANRGIGRAICTSILKRQPTTTPLTLYATSRQGEDLGLSSTTSSFNGQEVVYPRLDISDRASIRAFADEVASRQSGVDVLINNAGVNLEAEYGYESARRTLEVNYWGTVEMCTSLLPLLRKRPSSRIVNLTSVASSLKDYSSTIQQRFRDPNLTEQDLDALAEKYLSSVKAGNESSAGFFGPGRSYNVSKALVNAYTRLLSHRHHSSSNLTANCCCPGWIATDMGRLVGSGKIQPPKTAEEGARIPVRLAIAEDLGGVSGEYWANESIRGTGEGSVQVW